MQLRRFIGYAALNFKHITKRRLSCTLIRPMANDSADVAIVWYRNTDLRTDDHEPLYRAHEKHDSVLHVYCAGDEFRQSVDDGFAFGAKIERPAPIGIPKVGFHRRKFLAECLRNLDERLKAKGSRLITEKGNADRVLTEVVKKTSAHSSAPRRSGVRVYFHEGESVEELRLQSRVMKSLEACGCTCVPLWGNTLVHRDDLPFDPEEEMPATHSAFRRAVERRPGQGKRKGPKVHFSKSSDMAGLSDRGPAAFVRKTLPEPKVFKPEPASMSDGGGKTASTTFAAPFDVGPAPAVSRKSLFVGGQDAAKQRLDHYFFKTDSLKSYKETRNGMLGDDYSSKLSPWLAHGCISPLTVYEAVEKYERERVGNQSTYWLVFELLVRDFFRFYALYWKSHIYQLEGPKRVLTPASSHTWGRSKQTFDLWANGKTGVPIIDAAMREMLATGFQSNRARQICASFLVRDMGIDWRMGAMHFEGHLVDMDPASNYGNWTYSAGVGADPREDRYFHPIKQARTYDPKGAFVRHWLPEIPADTPLQALFDPWSHRIVSDSYPSPPLVKMKGRPYTKSSTSRRGGGGKRKEKKGRTGRRSRTSGRVQHF
eukprot:g1236.t1